MTGKWSQAGVPRKGWTCVGSTDLGKGQEKAICEMCERQEIRYVQHMTHPDYAIGLDVGTDCAGRMEENYSAATKRELATKQISAWLKRSWKQSNLGFLLLNTNKLNIRIYENDGVFSAIITDRVAHKTIKSEHEHLSLRGIKIAIFHKIGAIKRMRELSLNPKPSPPP